jgi:signal transduction histidine kinase
VLYNLLSNAIGFSNPGGAVRLSLRREGGMAVFTVEDEGIGIPKEQQQRVFDRFESRTYGSKHRGAGLGLSIVKSLVELHGGDMALTSEPGRGTRVTVRFPIDGAGGARQPAISARS